MNKNNTNTTEKQTIYQAIATLESKEERKEFLINLSNSAKLLIELEKTKYEKVNDVIINDFYKNQDHQEFNTFKNWKEKGYIVKKGSKGFFVWSKPIKAKKNKTKDQEQTEDKKQYKFFGIAYIFSNAQVQPLKA